MAAQAPGWAAELSGTHTPETEEYGITSVLYRAARRFHPARLLDALDGWEGVLRSEGFCYLASRPEVLAVWSQAGPNLTFEPGELLDPGSGPGPGQGLVFIGIGLDRGAPTTIRCRCGILTTCTSTASTSTRGPSAPDGIESRNRRSSAGRASAQPRRG